MNSKKTFRPPVEPAVTLLQACAPEALRWDSQEIQLSIARRASELFETRNRERAHDWEDWFQAESELLRPVSIAASEFPDRFSVLANVLGFEANELNVSVEPNRISIRGRKKINRSVAAEKAPPADFYPDQMLRMVDISSDVDPAGAVIELQSGILKFELPKVPKPVEKAVGAGKA